MYSGSMAQYMMDVYKWIGQFYLIYKNCSWKSGSLITELCCFKEHYLYFHPQFSKNYYTAP